MREMEITGKEYKRKLEMVKVEVTHFLKVKCSFSSPLTQEIWEKRKCFTCGDKFKDGDNPVVAITKHPPNKILCEKCFSGMGYPLIEIKK
jgi:hypothetical protein